MSMLDRVSGYVPMSVRYECVWITVEVSQKCVNVQMYTMVVEHVLVLCAIASMMELGVVVRYTTAHICKKRQDQPTVIACEAGNAVDCWWWICTCS
jgi:hypothetical protein